MPAPALVLFTAFLEVCLLRRRPQDLPHSLFLLKLTLAAYAAANIGLAAINLAPGPAVAAGVLDTVLLVAVTMVLLQLRRLPRRLPQTLTALAGSGALLNLLAAPVMLWLAALPEPAREGLPALLILGLVVWSLAVMAHILRHALDIPFFGGLLLAIAYFWLLLTAVYIVAPASGGL